MKSGRIRRDEDIFIAARLIADPQERKAFVLNACGPDVLLADKVLGLLEADEAAAEFFSDGSLAVPKRELCTRLRMAATGASVPGEEPIGTRIGRYRLCEKIGEGGWGVVYVAEQEEPVRRKVALKIIKLGMETKSVIARFEAERQALAMMDHPNIARVYDAGATDRGPPYFVMEWVQGVRITKHCDQHRLPIRKRLDLFVQVCHAIQHAHQKGIIHGDIKPSNIMVTSHDGVAEPKVIDFGIAKATEVRLSERMFLSLFEQLIGTPAYMSPEQADASGMDVDTRSDIYSLGALLYELLAGTTPYDANDLVKNGIEEMRRILREKDPLRPSVRLAQLPKVVQAKTAQDRQADPSKLKVQLQDDLDWIVMKALEKDRRRRYETANGLALDIQRYLNNEPVSARPPSRFYKLGKLVRRNRVVFAAGGAVTLALVFGLGTSTWLFLKEREARRRAVAAEQQQGRLRQEAEARERISHAALLISQEEYDKADRLLDDASLSQPTIEGASVLRSVSEWFSLQQQWDRAKVRGTELLQVDRLDSLDVTALDHLRVGPVLIESGDVDGYERFRRQTIARFGSAPCPYVDRIIKISLLIPAGESILTSLRPYANDALRYLDEAEKSGDVFSAAWRCISLGLYEYRLGHYETAAVWSRRCLAYPGANAPRTATAQVILAMADHRLGKEEEARAALKVGREIIDSKFHSRLDPGGPVQGFWFDWVFARILLRESITELEILPRPAMPPLK